MIAPAHRRPARHPHRNRSPEPPLIQDHSRRTARTDTPLPRPDARVLLIHPADAAASPVSRLLERLAVSVQKAATAERAWSAVGTGRFDLIIIDTRVHHLSEATLLSWLTMLGQNPPVIVTVGGEVVGVIDPGDHSAPWFRVFLNRGARPSSLGGVIRFILAESGGAAPRGPETSGSPAEAVPA